ncbi:hypothetical protein [Pseudoxanthomonas sp. LARHCG66]
MGRAENQFREAFGRLKEGKPIHLPKGSKVSQNNVAKEAGVDPSALRRSRFPALIEEIQAWVAAAESVDVAQKPSQQQVRQERRDLRMLLADMKVQRDDALSKLVGAELRLVELMTELDQLRLKVAPSTVVPLRAGKS